MKEMEGFSNSSERLEVAAFGKIVAPLLTFLQLWFGSFYILECYFMEFLI